MGIVEPEYQHNDNPYYKDLKPNKGEDSYFNKFKKSVYRPVENIFSEDYGQDYYKTVEQVLQQI